MPVQTFVKNNTDGVFKNWRFVKSHLKSIKTVCKYQINNGYNINTIKCIFSTETCNC